MYKRILIPVDGSEVSNHALAEGLDLAKALGSDVTVLYVVDTAVASIPDAESGISNIELIIQTFREQGEKLLETLKAGAREKGLNVDAIMVEGDVHDEIISTAAEKKTELIVMGTHGRRGVGRLLLGSVAESVTRRARCAVLLIPPV
jgi:nucleotide-binding universal stress UspA family protein